MWAWERPILSFFCTSTERPASPAAGPGASASDVRLKKDITRLTGALDSLLSLEGVSFEYVDPASINELPGARMGLVAQDVERVFPDWIEQGEDGYKRMTVRGFEAVAIEAMRELRLEKDAQIETLQQENDTLRERLAAPRGCRRGADERGERVMNTLILIASAALIGPSPNGGDFTIGWWTIDGGGGVSSGGSFELAGTIGQHDAGATMTGGSFELTGGFWAGFEEEGSCFADFDGNGVLNILDFVAYQNAFVGGDLSADCDNNGVLNILDFVCFQNEFQTGC